MTISGGDRRSGLGDWGGLAARCLVGGVWIVAGSIKLWNPAESVQAVRAYQLLPSSIVPTVGQLLPILEVVVGAALLLGLLTRAAAIVSSVLFAAFVVGIASAWARGITIDCGCFGGGGYDPAAQSKYPWEIARDTGLLLVSAVLVWRPSSRLAVDPLLFRRAPEHEGI